MATLVITKSYSQGAVLTEAQLDAIRTSLQTFVNTTKLNASNIQADAIAVGMSATGANGVSGSLNSTGAMTVFSNISATEGQILQAQNNGTGAVVSTESQTATSTSVLNNVNTSGTWIDTSNATVTVTARNRPILFTLQGFKASIDPRDNMISLAHPGNAGIRLVRDGVAIAKYGFNRPALNILYLKLGTFKFIDPNPGTGSKVYKLQHYSDSNALSVDFKLVATEL